MCRGNQVTGLFCWHNLGSTAAPFVTKVPPMPRQHQQTNGAVSMDKQERMQRIIELKKSGMSYAKVAKEVGLSEGYILDLLSNKEARQEMIDMTGGACQMCGLKGERLIAHHEDYANAPSMILCNSCHQKLHMGTVGKPFATNAERQRKRNAELQAAAERDGFASASAALTAWKHGAARLVPVKRRKSNSQKDNKHGK
jgi:hypothetical protein